jgi:hypothetical protein
VTPCTTACAVSSPRSAPNVQPVRARPTASENAAVESRVPLPAGATNCTSCPETALAYWSRTNTTMLLATLVPRNAFCPLPESAEMTAATSATAVALKVVFTLLALVTVAVTSCVAPAVVPNVQLVDT